MPRLSRECIITEKIDGTNAQVCILTEADYIAQLAEMVACNESGPRPTATANGLVLIAGSRTRWIRPKGAGEKGDPDNYGFAAWCKANAEELFKLGPGKHFGEWYGAGINRAYGMTNGDRRFALFNVSRWFRSSPEESLPGISRFDETTDMGAIVAGPSCCYVVPTLYRGTFDSANIELSLNVLETLGSRAVPGFMRPEGIVVYHVAAGQCFKKTIENDETPRSLTSEQIVRIDRDGRP